MPRKKLYPDLSNELEESGLSSSTGEKSIDSEGNETEYRALRKGLTSFQSLGASMNRSSSYSSLNEGFSDRDESFEEWYSNAWNNINLQIEDCCSKIQEYISIQYLFGSLALAFILLFSFNSFTAKPADGELYKTLGDRTKQIIDKYPLSAPFYAMEVKRSLRQVVRYMSGVELEPLRQPMIVLIASKDNDKANELIKEFMELITRYVPHSTSSYRSEKELNRTEFEGKIFQELKKLTVNEQLALLAIYDIHQLRNTSPLVIHNISDSENPAFRNVIYIMTVKIDENPGPSSSECVEAVTKKLAEEWISEHLGEDQTYPIIARISALSVCLV